MFTTSAILTCATAPADAFAAAPPSGAAWRDCRIDAVGAGGVDRPQDRADVVRILDAVEDDDQRRPVRAAQSDLRRRASAASSHLGHDALMHAAAGRAIELARARRGGR